MSQIYEDITNTQNLGSKMAAFYYDHRTMLERFSDITLVVGHNEFRLHKAIICATSPVLSDMCQFGLPTDQPIPLSETEQGAEVFEDFVKYLYTGDIRLTLDNVVAIMALADKYEVEDLRS